MSDSDTDSDEDDGRPLAVPVEFEEGTPPLQATFPTATNATSAGGTAPVDGVAQPPSAALVPAVSGARDEFSSSADSSALESGSRKLLDIAVNEIFELESVLAQYRDMVGSIEEVREEWTYPQRE